MMFFFKTTSENQKNNTNKNISTINLGDCENKLKEIYKIDPSLPLIIFKIGFTFFTIINSFISFSIT